MGTKLLFFMGVGSLALMVIGLVIIQHQSSHDSDTTTPHLIICRTWVGALCLFAGWQFSSAYRSYGDLAWPKWPFLLSSNAIV
jgi:hypothetical protein